MVARPLLHTPEEVVEDVRDSIATIHLGGKDGSVAEGGKQLARMPTHVRVGLLSCRDIATLRSG